MQLQSASKNVNTISLKARAVRAQTWQWKSLGESAGPKQIMMDGGIGACASSENMVVQLFRL